MIARLLPAALAWAALPWAAAAADLPAPAAPPVMLPAAPAFTWTGFHLGGEAGYASDRTKLGGFTGPFAPYLGGRREYGLSTATDGFTGGAQLGYDFQFGAGAGPVVGIEADLSYADLARDRALPGAGPGSLTATYRTSLDEIGTVRARAGYGFGPLLVYGTGGVAFGKADRQSVLSGLGGSTALRLDLRDLDMGYAVGGGVEYALPIGLAPALLGAGAVTLRAEYIHVDMGQDGVPLTVGPQAFTAHLRAGADIGRTGINYKF